MKTIIVLIAMLFAMNSYAGETMKTFYITAPWIPGKVIKVSGKDRLDALTHASITVWTEKEWQGATKLTGTTKEEEIDWAWKAIQSDNSPTVANDEK